MQSKPDKKSTMGRGPVGAWDQAERRKSQRFLLREIRGTLGWHGDDGEHSCEVAVLNISGGGAAVMGTSGPTVGQAVRLQLPDRSATADPVEATVVATSTASGGSVLHLRFARWMPLDWLMDRSRERRLWERYPAVESRGTLTWFEESKERVEHGELLNISGGGAAFASEHFPPPHVPIWLRLDASDRLSERIEPVESRLVGTSLDPSGLRIAHLQFVEPCPMALFDLAVNGAELPPAVR
jgi:hypothetical protein